jgi:outer membrane protein OmpA-like peptidoglycan-associated protein
MNKFNNLVLKFFINFFLILIPISLHANHHKYGFVIDSFSGAIFDSQKNCVRTTFQSQGAQIEKCSKNGTTSIKKNEKKEPLQQTQIIKPEIIEPVKPEIVKPVPPNQKTVFLAFDAEINFLFDKSFLTKESKVLLDVFIKTANKRSYNIINILGHADALGTDNYNLQLSLKRALTVKKYLIDAGIPEQLLSITGLGEREPVGNNDTREGRAMNRRVFLELK